MDRVATGAVGIAGTNVQRTARDELSLLSRAEMQEILGRRDDLPLFHFSVSVLLVFALPFLFALYPGVLTGVICALFNLHAYNRFAQFVHGSDHAALLKNARWNAAVGKLAGYFLGYAREGHKATHNEHHLYLNTEKDADRVWCEPEAKVESMFRGWLRDFFLISAFQRFFQYSSGVGQRDRPSQGENAKLLRIKRALSLEAAIALAPAVLIQGALVLAYWFAGGVQYYLLLYALPIITLYPALIRLRSNVEHAFDPGFQPRTPQERRVVRSIKANWFERFVMAPIYVEYHYEHHLLPNLPYYNSPRMRQLLLDKGFEIPLAKGYFAFIWKKWRTERAMARTAATT